MACSCARAATLSGIAAARHGLHVLGERPIDISPGRADALIAAAERAGVLCGNVAPVNARTATALHRIEAEDLALALLEFENGALGVLEITGTGGTVIVAGDRIVAADLKNPRFSPSCRTGRSESQHRFTHRFRCARARIGHRRFHGSHP